jgi:hypothetical protein
MRYTKPSIELFAFVKPKTEKGCYYAHVLFCLSKDWCSTGLLPIRHAHGESVECFLFVFLREAVLSLLISVFIERTSPTYGGVGGQSPAHIIHAT